MKDADSNFRKDRYTCKICVSEDNHERYLKNYALNKEKILKKTKEHYNENKKYYSDYQKKHWKKYVFNSQEEYRVVS